MTVAYDGRKNLLGASLFVLSLSLLVIGVGATLFAVVRLYARAPATRLQSRITFVAGRSPALALSGLPSR
jgi:hypothetical protein